MTVFFILFFNNTIKKNIKSIILINNITRNFKNNIPNFQIKTIIIKIKKYKRKKLMKQGQTPKTSSLADKRHPKYGNLRNNSQHKPFIRHNNIAAQTQRQSMQNMITYTCECSRVPERGIHHLPPLS
jgi:hypothetical protein